MKKILLHGLVAIIFGSTALAQLQIQTIQKKFDEYQTALPKTNLQLVFNQHKYSPGDTAYFKAYFFYQNRKRVEGKQLIQIDLVDSMGNSRMHIMLQVNNGAGSNQLPIPVDLPAGIYNLIGYSNWMRNFDPSFFFKCEIQIVKKNRLIPERDPAIKIGIEGGNLISGIRNGLVAQVYKGNREVKIFSEDGIEVISCISDLNGFARLSFVPLFNKRYIVKIDKPHVTIPLSQVHLDGYALQLDRGGYPKNLKLNLVARPGSKLRQTHNFILLTGAGRILYANKFLHSASDSVQIDLPISDLPEGVIHISILDHTGTLIASRDFYSIGNGLCKASMTIDKPSFETRDKVSVQLDLLDDNGMRIGGEFSVKVLNQSLFTDEEMYSSFKSNLETIARLEQYPLVGSMPDRDLLLDNFFIAETKDIPWKDILSTHTSLPKFQLTGTIENVSRAYLLNSDKPVADGTQIQLYLQRSGQVYNAMANKNGKFQNAFFDFFGQDQIFYLAQERGGEVVEVRVEWENDILVLPPSRGSIETSIVDDYGSFNYNRNLIESSFHTYAKTVSGISLGGSENKELPLVYRITPDILFNVQDYVSFPTMKEFLKEVVQSVFIRQIDTSYMIRIKNLEPKMATTEPVYFIDGIATRNTDFFLSIKPKDISSIGVINKASKLQPFGLLGKNGILIIKTTLGKTREPVTGKSQVIEGLSKPKNYPNVNQNHNNVGPIFKSTIFWDPSVFINSNGQATINFFCSDDVGDLSVIVEGVTADGRFFESRKKITVININQK
jgi:hypothetical protein